MPDHLPQSGSSTSSAGLLLRVSRTDGRMDEFYLAHGLTIGRTLANTVVLADDDTVDRTHARVDLGEDGSARLRCLGADNVISLGNTTVRELGLTGGVAFRIGQTNFECLPGQRVAETGHAVLRGVACPHCGSKAAPAVNPLAVPCPSCGQAVLALDLGLGYPTPFVVPVRFGDFQAQRFVARGGMGIVLRGQAEATQQPVAIKILLPGKGVDRQASERFKQEIALMKRVVHPNVVKLLGYGRVGLFNFLVMEWIDGHNLRDAIAACKQQQRLPRFDDVLPWLEQICKGLAAIHAVGIVHRDIKPSNVLIAQDGRILLSDLGVAKRTDQGQTALTTTGQLPGTYEYMAPEQLAAPDTVDQRTDLYSLGVMFYELLTGERPVGAWLPASQVNPGVPVAADQIVSRLLARKAENRYADIHELMAALSDLRPRTETARTGSDPEQAGSLRGSFLSEILAQLRARGPENRYVDIDKLPAAILAQCPASAARTGTVLAQPCGREIGSLPERQAERGHQRCSPIQLRRVSDWLCRLSAYPCLRNLTRPQLENWCFLGLGVFCLALVACFFFTGGVIFWALLMMGGLGILVICEAQLANAAKARNSNPCASPATSPAGETPCPECGHQVSEEATLCPQWGRAMLHAQRVPDGPAGIAGGTSSANPDLPSATTRGAVPAAAPSSPLQRHRPVLVLLLAPIPALLLLVVALLTGRGQTPPLPPPPAPSPATPPVSPTATADYWKTAVIEPLALAEPEPTDGQTIQGFLEATTGFWQTTRARVRTLPVVGVDRELVQMVQRHSSEEELLATQCQTLAASVQTDVSAKDAMARGEKLLTGELPLPPNSPAAKWLESWSQVEEKWKADIRTMQQTLSRRYPSESFPMPEWGTAPTLKADACRNRGVKCLTAGDLDGAVAAFTQAIQSAPNGFQAYCGRALAYLDKGELDKAITDATEAIRLAPQEAIVYESRGQAYLLKGEADKAIADFTEAIRLDPKSVTAYSNRGSAYLDRGDFDKAIEDCTVTIRMDSQDALAYRNRGVAYLRKADLTKCIADVTESIRINPRDAKAFCIRGAVSLEKGDTDVAIADSTEAIRLDPRCGLAYALRGEAYAKKGDKAKADEDLAQAKKLDFAEPEDGRGLRHEPRHR